MTCSKCIPGTFKAADSAECVACPLGYQSATPASTACKLLILPGGCDANYSHTPGWSDGDFAKYGAANGIVVLKPCQGSPIDAKRFPANHENLRGMVDVYGQLSASYATQAGDQMAPIGRMMKRLLGVEEASAAGAAA